MIRPPTVIRKSTVVLLAGFALIIGIPGHVTAQTSGNAVTYNTTTKGEITATAEAIQYTFNGKAQDIAVITLAQDGVDSSLAPQINLLDASGKLIVDTSNQLAISRAVLAVQLALDGTYTIVATHQKGDNPDSPGNRGQFALTLSLAKPLLDGAVLTDKTSSDQVQYYAFQTGTSFSVAYEKTSGDFTPTLAINQIDQGELKPIAEITGDNVKKGSLDVTVQSAQSYVISVGQSNFDFDLTPTNANYTLVAKVDS